MSARCAKKAYWGTVGCETPNMWWGPGRCGRSRKGGLDNARVCLHGAAGRPQGRSNAMAASAKHRRGPENIYSDYGLRASGQGRRASGSAAQDALPPRPWGTKRVGEGTTRPKSSQDNNTHPGKTKSRGRPPASFSLPLLLPFLLSPLGRAATKDVTQRKSSKCRHKQRARQGQGWLALCRGQLDTSKNTTARGRQTAAGIVQQKSRH